MIRGCVYLSYVRIILKLKFYDIQKWVEVMINGNNI